MLIKTKTLFNGFASVSTILINRCKNKNEDMKIEHKKRVMTIPILRLDSPDWIHKQTFKDKYKDRTYRLYNFKFVEDKDNKQESLLWVRSAPSFLRFPLSHQPAGLTY